jgi:transcriptional regulator with XRE-family HTH domain
MEEMPKKRKGTNGLPFGKNLKVVMKERGLTVRAIAEMAGVSASVAQGWVSSANPHDLQAVAQLAKALKVGFKELLLGEPETPGVADINNLFDSHDLLEGICKVKIERLVPKRGK